MGSWLKSQLQRYNLSTQHLYWERGKDGRTSNEVAEGLPDRRLLLTYFKQQLSRLGRRLNVRQLVLATAQVYILRFYSRVPYTGANPYAVLATAFYVACKMEECPQHIRIVITEARNLWPEAAMLDTAKIGEYEFWIISALDSQLVIHHPYRALDELQKALGMTRDEMTLAWSVINDHYTTQLPLLYPPHAIAAAAATLTYVLQPGRTVAELGESHMAMTDSEANVYRLLEEDSERAVRVSEALAHGECSTETLAQCVQEMISLYAVLEGYDARKCREQLNAFVTLHRL